MRKMIAVAAASLTLGGLMGAYGFQGHADAASSPQCPASVKTRFNIMLGQGIIKRIPPGCADALLHDLYVDVYTQSVHSQTLDASLARLEGRLDALCQRMQTTC